MLRPVNIELPVSTCAAATGKLEFVPTEAAAVNIQTKTEKENQSQSTETKGKNIIKGSGGK